MNRRSRQLRLLLLIVTALCLPPGLTAQTKPSNPTVELLKSIGIAKPAMSKAPDFTLRDIGGGTVSLASYRGGLVLLNFWATWCGPCRDEMPSMENLSRNFGGQGLSLLAINQKESAAQVTSYMKTHGLNFPTPLDSDGRVSAAYRVFGIPVTYLIDGNGNALGRTSGARDWATRDVVQVFRKLIGEGGGSAPTGGSLDLEPSTPLPSALRAKGGALIVRAQQDPFSEAIAKLPANDEVVPLGKVSGAGEFWYMVRTKSGAIGWVRGADVDEVRRGK
jgi:thiol-disulfide isomerase/thioredoxin